MRIFWRGLWALNVLWLMDAGAAPVSFEEISRIADVNARWVASDGQSLATGSGRDVHWGVVGPPMRLTHRRTLEHEIESGLLAGPRLIFTTADRRLGLLLLDRPDAAPLMPRPPRFRRQLL